MNTTDFAAELGTDSRTARKFLRNITPKDEQPGKGSRWDLPEGKREINKLKKQFSDWKASQEKPSEDEVNPQTEADGVEVTDEV